MSANTVISVHTTPPPHHKTVELTVVRYADAYVVKSIKNTTWYVPGDRLTRDVVKTICEKNTNWEVTIIDNDLLQQIFGGITSHLPIP